MLVGRVPRAPSVIYGGCSVPDQGLPAAHAAHRHHGTFRKRRNRDDLKGEITRQPAATASAPRSDPALRRRAGLVLLQLSRPQEDHLHAMLHIN